MTRTKLIVVLLIVALIASPLAAYSLLPKRYSVVEQLAQTNIFWHDSEAFLFLYVRTTGRADNFVLDKLGKSRLSFGAYFLDGSPRFASQEVAVYRLLPSGELKQLPLPDKASLYGTWSLQGGKLQLAPRANDFDQRNGYQWDGEKFIPVPPQPESTNQIASDSRRSPDDQAEADDATPGFLTKRGRDTFRAAGWHYKQLNGWETNTAEAILPMTIGDASFDLRFTHFPKPDVKTAVFEILTFGFKSLSLSRTTPPEINLPVWSQNGWQPVSKNQFEARARLSGRSLQSPLA